jgi:hypothetical protein
MLVKRNNYQLSYYWAIKNYIGAVIELFILALRYTFLR